MKAYRNPSITIPEPFEPVLVFCNHSEIAFVAYYDEGFWFEAHTSEPLDLVSWWMPIPLKPYQ